MDRLDFPPMDQVWFDRARRRYARALIGGEGDHIPVDTMMLSHAAVVCGYSIREFYEQPELGAHCVAYANQMYDLLPMARWFFALPWATELGLELRPMEVTAPVPVGPIISDPSQVDQIEVPSVEDLRRGRTFELLKRTNSYIQEHLPQMFTPITYASEPLGGGAELCGMENFIMWTLVERDAAKRLVRIYADTCINGAQLMADEYGFASITTGAVFANSDIFDPETLKDMAVENLRYVVNGCLRAGAGPQVFYHFCGNHDGDYMLYKDQLIYTPFTIMQIGYNGREAFPADLLMQEFGRNCTIEASVDTKQFLTASPASIYEQSCRQIVLGRDSPKGFILCTACEVPPFSPPGNIHAMVRASEDVGTYGSW